VGSTLNYLAVDSNDELEIQNTSGSLESGNSATVSVRVQPRWVGNPAFVTSHTYFTVLTPDALNFTQLPLGLAIKDNAEIALGLLGTWNGTWSGTSRGRDFPGVTTPTAPVSGTWILKIDSVDIVNHSASGTLTWKGTDAFWTYTVDGPPATSHPFTPDRTIPFGSGNTQLNNMTFMGCNQGHHFQLIINGGNLPFPHDGYGPTIIIDMFVDSGTVPGGPTSFNANPYNPQNGDVALSHGQLTGTKVQ
jgi:hypothetical protein